MEEEKSLHGWVAPVATKAELHDAVEKAFDYRGDVTITLKDGATVAGYVFNRIADAPEPFLQVIVQGKDERLRIPYAQVAGLAFTGPDLAAGNSWAAYIAKVRRNKGAVAS